MRLVSKWAATMGASEDQIAELASASDLSDALPSVQLAFTWTEGLDLSDLYRREKLINYGPKGAPPGTDKGHRRTKAEIEEANIVADAELSYDEFAGMMDASMQDHRFARLDDERLARLRARAREFLAELEVHCHRRKLKPLPDDWRLQESRHV
jgi:hypothetical protein